MCGVIGQRFKGVHIYSEINDGAGTLMSQPRTSSDIFISHVLSRSTHDVHQLHWYAGRNHLSEKHITFPRLYVHFRQTSAPTKFGLLTRGVYRVPPSLFLTEATSLWHFQTIVTVSKDLGQVVAVNKCIALTYGFIKHEHYNHLRLCEHGLSSIFTIAITQNITQKLYHFDS